MKWYQLKEQAAGEKRLLITWKIYKLFGKKAVKVLAFFVTFFAFIGAKEARRCSKKFLEIIGLKPTLINQFRHFLEYSYSLVDRMEVFSGNYDLKKIIFDSEDDKKALMDDFPKGVFFICSHLGNIDVMRAFLNKYPERHVNVFLSGEQCRIFNNFIKQIEADMPVSTYPVEEINIDTSIEIKDKLPQGQIVFMAGDRTSKNSSNSDIELFGHKVKFPLGTFKFAQLMESPVYFVCAIRNGEIYRVYLKKFITTSTKSASALKMQKEFAQFLEDLTRHYPLQFFHFYDMFD